MDNLIDIFDVNKNLDNVNSNNFLINASELIYTEMINSKNILDLNEIQNKVYNKIILFVNTIQPKNLVYIGFDGMLSKQDLINKKQKYILSTTNSIHYSKLIDILYNSNINTCIANKLKESLQQTDKYSFKLMVSDEDIPSSADQKITNYIKRNYNMSQVNVVYGVDLFYIFTLEKIVYFYSEQHNTFLSLNSLQSNIKNFYSNKIEFLDISMKNLLIDILYILILSKKLPLFDLNGIDTKLILKYYLDYLTKYCEHIVTSNKILSKIDIKINYKNLSKFLKLVKFKLKNNNESPKIHAQINNDIIQYERFPQHKNYNYIKSILWYLKAYINYQPSNTWAYMYYLNPNIYDLVEYIDKQDYELFNINYYTVQISNNKQLEYFQAIKDKFYIWNGIGIIPF